MANEYTPITVDMARIDSTAPTGTLYAELSHVVTLANNDVVYPEKRAFTVTDGAASISLACTTTAIKNQNAAYVISFAPTGGTERVLGRIIPTASATPLNLSDLLEVGATSLVVNRAVVGASNIVYLASLAALQATTGRSTNDLALVADVGWMRCAGASGETPVGSLVVSDSDGLEWYLETPSVRGFPQVFDVCLYGAVGAPTEDTTAIAAAITAADAVNGVVYFPPKAYVSDTLTIPSGVTLLGHGATLRFKTGEAGNLLAIDGPTDVRIEGLTLDGQDTTTYVGGTSVGTRSGVYVNNSQRVTISRCYIKGFDKHGISVADTGHDTDYGNAVTIDCCELSNNWANLFFGTRAEYCKVVGTTATKGRYGIWIQSGNVYCGDSMFNYNVDGVYLLNGTNDAHGVFSGCSINHNTAFALHADSIANGHTFSGCHLYYGDIYLDGCTGVQIIGGHIGCDGSDITTIYCQGGGWNVIRDNFLAGPVAISHGYSGSADKVEFINNRKLDGAASIDSKFSYPPLRVFMTGLTAATVTATATVVYDTATREELYGQTTAADTLYDSSNGIGLCPVSGLYAFTAILKFNNAAAADCQVILWLEADGVKLAYEVFTLEASAANEVRTLAATAFLAAGTTYRVRAEAGGSGITLVSSESTLRCEHVGL